MTLRVLIVDDEELARARLRRLLSSLPDLEIAGEAEDAEGALAQLRASAPDCVLLDIELPGLDGISLALAHALPPVVFVTAYPEHAVTAFDAAAVDYLLKPVRADRLRRAIDRVRAMSPRAAEGFAPVTARRGARVQIFDARTITRFRAEQKYTAFRVDDREHLTEESLGELAARLEPLGFLRVHRAELVRADAIRSIELAGRGATITLVDGQRAAVSRRMLPTVKLRLGIR